MTLAAQLVAEHRDVLDARPVPGLDPAPLIARGFRDALLDLTDAELEAIESRGLEAPWPARTPASLRAFVDALRAACAVEPFSAPVEATPAQRGESPRKRAQIDAFAAACAPLAARAKRVIDVGAGHGHLTRDLAARLGVPVVGLERDARLGARARALAAPLEEAAPVFAITDVLLEGLPVDRGDCVIGLHACGELGDAIVERAAVAADAVVLVGCCLQKRRTEVRVPLSHAADERLHLPRAVLGASNARFGDQGVEATRAENVAARERRIALHRLLATHLGPLDFGAEIAGLNRRAAHADLDTLVERAFVLRGAAVPSRAAIGETAAFARREHARLRRLSLPRSLLARAVEVFVLHDRAELLRRSGFTVRVGALFPAEVSARNLVLVAARA